MTSWTRRAIIIIPIADQAAANLYFKDNIDPEGWASTFEDELSSDGNAPATHYWCDGAFLVSEWGTIVGGFSTEFPNALVYRGENAHDSNPSQYSQSAALADAGLQEVIT